MAEQRYKAVQAVLAEGQTVMQVARDCGVSRQTIHGWLAKYEGDGLEGLGNRSRRRAHCPHQMPATVEVMVLEMRRSHPSPAGPSPPRCVSTCRGAHHRWRRPR